MDRKVALRKLASRVNLILPYVESEELTENALVMPFLQLLGFDADRIRSDTAIGIRMAKKEKRPSYAIFKGGRLNILVACAHHRHSLEEYEVFLNKFWQKSKPRYGMLTNGIEYRFYSATMMRLSDFSKPLFGFVITKTHAGRIDRILNEHKDLLAIN